jgi:hypothetical protein
MKEVRKSRAFNPRYESPTQGVLAGFEHPFERSLDKTNRWVVLSGLIPWDEICSMYLKQTESRTAGRTPLNPRIVIGALIIKHICNLDDRETVEQISENIYMQYFLGYSSFTSDKPFDASLFVSIRKRLGFDALNAINEKIVTLKTHFEEKANGKSVPSVALVSEKGANDSKGDSEPKGCEHELKEQEEVKEESSSSDVHKGILILDATVCPQDIAYPTDLDLLSEAREISERLIDSIYDKYLHEEKPRTYRHIARKEYLHTAQKKKKSKKQIRNAVRKQLGYLARNIRSIHRLLDSYAVMPFDKKELQYFYVIQTLYEQQLTMFKTRTHTIEHRIVSIHQPHVRPIVRGKSSAPVEFGSKIHVSLINGISFLDELSWDAFNEGSHMEDYVENYRSRFGFYPREVLADKIYCTRDNRKMLKSKGLGIVLKAKPLGRPSSAAALSNHVSPGERNPIEGKFGQAKTAYGLNRIKARLKETSESWIAGIFLVLNLVKLAEAVASRPIVNMYYYFSAQVQGLTNDINVWLQYFKRIPFNQILRLSTTLNYLNF